MYFSNYLPSLFVSFATSSHIFFRKFAFLCSLCIGFHKASLLKTAAIKSSSILLDVSREKTDASVRFDSHLAASEGDTRLVWPAQPLFVCSFARIIHPSIYLTTRRLSCHLWCGRRLSITFQAS